LHLSFAIIASLRNSLLVWNIPEACLSWFKGCCLLQRATTLLLLFKSFFASIDLFSRAYLSEAFEYDNGESHKK
jgi:hypothetical protein